MSELTQATQKLLAARHWFWYFRQDEQWFPRGKAPVPIADMDATWRYNSAGWLVRNADRMAGLYRLGCEAESLWVDLHVTAEMAHDGLMSDLELEAEVARRDPAAWVVQTALYRALVAGLPNGY